MCARELPGEPRQYTYSSDYAPHCMCLLTTTDGLHDVRLWKLPHPPTSYIQLTSEKYKQPIKRQTSHGGDEVDIGLLSCCTLWSYGRVRTFRRKIVPPSSGLHMSAVCSTPFAPHNLTAQKATISGYVPAMTLFSYFFNFKYSP